MTEDQTADRIRQLVVDLLEVPEETLGEHTLFKDDLGVDSMTMLEVQAAVEREFSVEIPHDRVAGMTSLAALRVIIADATTRASTSAHARA